jgi:hypothetical protein
MNYVTVSTFVLFVKINIILYINMFIKKCHTLSNNVVCYLVKSHLHIWQHINIMINV